MAIQSSKNLYPGVNPHLNSFLQSEGGGWESFHARHVIDIASTLDNLLPDNYYAIAEKSLQISELGPGSESRRTRPDISIFQRSESSEIPLYSGAATAPTATLPLADVLEDEDDYLTSVVIYEIEGGKFPGIPVTRIELLSPANKMPHAYYRQYLTKRLETLRGGLCLVEVDYLHETRPVIPKLPSYRDGDREATPYTIVVSIPRPTPDEGHMDLFAFDVSDRLPTVRIPLIGEETVALDFNTIYQQTFEQVKVFRLVVDYTQEPVNFSSYSQHDQQYIRQKMAEIANGEDS